MANLKIPGISSVIGFFIIFIINLAKGNSFGLATLRSIIYGVFVFGIFYGLAFLFQNVLSIEQGYKKDDEKEDGERNEEQSKVNIVVDDEDEENFGMSNFETDNDDNQFTASDIDFQEDKETTSKNIKSNINSNDENELENEIESNDLKTKDYEHSERINTQNFEIGKNAVWFPDQLSPLKTPRK